MTKPDPIVVVGLGTAGAASAAFLARAGLPVVALDRRVVTEAGAGWVNGVPGWAFDAVGLERPSGDELHAPEAPFHLRAGWSGPQVTLRSPLDVDMRRFTARLLQAATANGATLLDEVVVHKVHEQHLQTSQGDLAFSVLVDASGHHGLQALRARPVDRTDLCAASQSVHRVVDRAGAEAWLRRQGARDGEVVCASGVAGGYSIVNVRVSGDRVAVLTGSIPALGHRSGVELLRDLLGQEPWIGERVSGGSRVIPLRRATEVIGWGRRVALGDSAGMVFTAHGSGIAQQLLAARLLAGHLGAGKDPWTFNVSWQRRYGGLLASTDLQRRASATLTVDELSSLLQHRVLSEDMAGQALAQHQARPSFIDTLRAVGGLAKLPRLARRMIPMLAVQPWIHEHYRRYPSRPTELEAWGRRLERLTGQPCSWVDQASDTLGVDGERS
jgi:flavin-dependent dehydrogenase